MPPPSPFAEGSVPPELFPTSINNGQNTPVSVEQLEGHLDDNSDDEEVDLVEGSLVGPSVKSVVERAEPIHSEVIITTEDISTSPLPVQNLLTKISEFQKQNHNDFMNTCINFRTANGDKLIFHIDKIHVFHDSEQQGYLLGHIFVKNWETDVSTIEYSSSRIVLKRNGNSYDIIPTSLKTLACPKNIQEPTQTKKRGIKHGIHDTRRSNGNSNSFQHGPFSFQPPVYPNPSPYAFQPHGYGQSALPPGYGHQVAFPQPHGYGQVALPFNQPNSNITNSRKFDKQSLTISCEPDGDRNRGGGNQLMLVLQDNQSRKPTMYSYGSCMIFQHIHQSFQIYFRIKEIIPTKNKKNFKIKGIIIQKTQANNMWNETMKDVVFNVENDNITYAQLGINLNDYDIIVSTVCINKGQIITLDRGGRKTKKNKLKKHTRNQRVLHKKRTRNK